MGIIDVVDYIFGLSSLVLADNGVPIAKKTLSMILTAYTNSIDAIKLRRKDALNKLELAKNDLKQAELELEPKLALTRALTHLESAQQILVEIDDEANSILVGLYMSVIHALLGNSSTEIYKTIWEQIPIKKLSFFDEWFMEDLSFDFLTEDKSFNNIVNFHEYDMCVRKFLDPTTYDQIIKKRSLKYIDYILETISYKKTQTLFSSTYGQVSNIKLSLLRYNANKRKDTILGKKNNDEFSFKLFWDTFKQW